MKKQEIHDIVLEAYDVKEPNILSRLDFADVKAVDPTPPKVKHRYIAAAAVYAAACLVIVIALPFFIGGRNDEPVKPDPGVDGTVNSESMPEDPHTDEPIEDDYAEDEFKFLHYGDLAEDGDDLYIWYDSSTGTAIADAVVERNRIVEEEHGISISAEAVADPAGEARSRMLAGQCNFDVILEKGTAVSADALDGFYYDFRDLERYGLNLDSSYWMPKAAEELTIAGQMYLATGYVTMDTLDNAQVLFFNKDLMTELGLSDSPYDYVNIDHWDYQTYFTMLIAAEDDLDKNGKITTADRSGGVSPEYLFEALLDRNNPAVKNEDGTYTAVPITDAMTHAYNQYCNMIPLVFDPWAEEGMSPEDELSGRIAAFGDDLTLFVSGELGLMRTELKELSESGFDYGIVPVPVADYGDEYVTRVDRDSYMLAVPSLVRNPGMTSAVLESLARESEKYVLPAYIEDTVKTMAFHDTRDYDMLDIIRDSISFDWTDIYMPDSTIGKMPMGYFGAGTFPTTEQLVKTCQAELDGVIAKLNALKEERGSEEQTEPVETEETEETVTTREPESEQTTTTATTTKPAPEPEHIVTEAPESEPDILPVCIYQPWQTNPSSKDTVNGVAVEPLTEQEEVAADSDMEKFRELYEKEFGELGSSATIIDNTSIGLRRNSDYRIYKVYNGIEEPWDRSYLMTGGKLYGILYIDPESYAAYDVNRDGVYEIYFTIDEGSGFSLMSPRVFDPMRGEIELIYNEEGEYVCGMAFHPIMFRLSESGDLCIWVDMDQNRKQGLGTLYRDETGKTVLKY